MSRFGIWMGWRLPSWATHGGVPPPPSFVVLSKLYLRLQVGSYLSSVGMRVGLVCTVPILRELGSFRLLGCILKRYCEVPVPFSLLHLCCLFSHHRPKAVRSTEHGLGSPNPNNLLTYEFIVSVDFHPNLFICWGKQSSTRAQNSRPTGLSWLSRLLYLAIMTFQI